MLTGQNIHYVFLPLRRFVWQEGMWKRQEIKEKERKEGQKKKRQGGKKYPNQTKKSKIAISVACILMRCKPLPNNISTENGKNDVL